MRVVARFGVSVLLLLTIAACAGVDKNLPSDEDVRARIAAAYGFESFGKIAQIQYQFNLEEDGEETIRQWMWKPKIDSVAYQGVTSRLFGTEYDRKYLAENPSPRHDKIDAWFVEDN